MAAHETGSAASPSRDGETEHSLPLTAVVRVRHWNPRPGACDSASKQLEQALSRADDAYLDASAAMPLEESFNCDSDDEQFVSQVIRPLLSSSKATKPSPQWGPGWEDVSRPQSAQRSRKRPRPLDVDASRERAMAAFERTISQLEAIADAAARARRALSVSTANKRASAQALQLARKYVDAVVSRTAPSEGDPSAVVASAVAARIRREMDNVRTPGETSSAEPTDLDSEALTHEARMLLPLAVQDVVEAMSTDAACPNIVTAAVVSHWASRRSVSAARRLQSQESGAATEERVDTVTTGALIHDAWTLQQAEKSFGPALFRVLASQPLLGRADSVRGLPESSTELVAWSHTVAERCDSVSSLSAALARLRHVREQCERARVLLDVTRRREKIKRAIHMTRSEIREAQSLSQIISAHSRGREEEEHAVAVTPPSELRSLFLGQAAVAALGGRADLSSSLTAPPGVNPRQERTGPTAARATRRGVYNK
jgi:hypothetical protein